MTKLDMFQPVGEPIHPFDLFTLLSASEFPIDVFNVEEAPPSEDENDYLRNINKLGQNILVGSRRYFVSTGVMPK